MKKAPYTVLPVREQQKMFDLNILYHKIRGDKH